MIDQVVGRSIPLLNNERSLTDTHALIHVYVSLAIKILRNMKYKLHLLVLNVI